MRAANISSPGSAQSPADAVNTWWSDYPAIAADIIGLQEKWSARVVPLVADGTPNITRQEAATLAAQFNDQVLADCRSMASRNVVGGTTPKVPTNPATGVSDHKRGTERVTRTLPPLKRYWTASMDTSNTLATSCIQAMLDAVPRIAAGQVTSVRADYASTPNLLYWLELEATKAPKGSAAGALKWMNAPDPKGMTDGEKEGIAQMCVGWLMP